MKRLFQSIVVLMLLSGVAVAQNVARIKSDMSFIHSEGIGLTPRIADSLCLESIATVISQEIDLPYSPVVKKQILRTFIPEIKISTEVVSSHKQSGNSSFRYISRNDIKRIFDSRRRKVDEMISLAEDAEKNGHIDVALRNLSWAETLLESVPPLDLLKIARVSSEREALLEGMKVKYKDVNKFDSHIVEITFLYQGKPVESVDYSFFDGTRWSGILSAKNGKGFVEIEGAANLDKFMVRYEINPAHLKNVAGTVADIKAALASHPEQEKPHQKPVDAVGGMASASLSTIDYDEVRQKVLDVISRSTDAVRRDTVPLTPVMGADRYVGIVTALCDAVSAGKYDAVSTFFTPEGYDIFTRLIAYGNARVLGTDDISVYAMGSEVYARSVPMVFTFNGNRRKFVEDVVFTFDGEGKISNLSFALDKSAADGIIGQEQWSEQARIILVNFLENYKTSYALKRLDYISSIYDEDALIITGRVLKSAGPVGEFGKNRYVQLTKRSKAEYIEQLERVFRSQEFINILFSDCKVVKLNKGEGLFGINIRQEYYSTTYSDEGYLFILADLTDTQRPLIHVRTWQEDPDSEFGIVGPYHF